MLGNGCLGSWRGRPELPSVGTEHTWGVNRENPPNPQPVPSLCATCDLCKPAVCWVPGAPDVGVASTPSRPGLQPPSLGDTERWGRFGAAWRPVCSCPGPGGAVSSVGKSAGEGAHAGCGLAPRLALFLHGRGALLDFSSGSPGWQRRALGSAALAELQSRSRWRPLTFPPRQCLAHCTKPRACIHFTAGKAKAERPALRGGVGVGDKACSPASATWGQ